MFRIVICIAISVLLFATVSTASNSTPEQAKAMMEKAVVFYESTSHEAALAEFNNPNGQFVNKDLYIVVLNQEGVVLANGRNKALVGKSMIGVPDVDGKYFTKEMIDVANAKGGGSVEYKFTNPETKKTAQKISFFKKVKDFVILCGAYK